MILYDAIHAFMEAAKTIDRPFIPAELADEWAGVIGAYVCTKMDREEEATLP